MEQLQCVAAWEDHGQGADMGFLYHHETLRHGAGIRPEQIKLVMNDTKTCPNAGPAGGSRSQVMSGNACRLAAENLRGSHEERRLEPSVLMMRWWLRVLQHLPSPQYPMAQALPVRHPQVSPQ